jgi:adenosylcobinamide-GDP ribazoletransferase
MRAAFVFFTRIPVGGFPYRKEDYRWAAAHAPLVGIVIGVALGAVERGLLVGLAPLAAAALTLALSLLVTGAFHEDGLADTSDALGGGYDPARVLAILKDSRIGSFGGAALAVSILARAALLASLGTSAAWAWPLVGCAARVAPVWLAVALPYVTPEAAKSRTLARPGPRQAAVASAWFLLVAVVVVAARLASIPRIAAVVAVLAAVTLFSGWRYRARAGGVTGDFLGATEQLGEIGALAALAWQ